MKYTFPKFSSPSHFLQQDTIIPSYSYVGAFDTYWQRYSYNGLMGLTLIDTVLIGTSLQKEDKILEATLFLV